MEDWQYWQKQIGKELGRLMDTTEYWGMAGKLQKEFSNWKWIVEILSRTPAGKPFPYYIRCLQREYLKSKDFSRKQQCSEFEALHDTTDYSQGENEEWNK